MHPRDSESAGMPISLAMRMRIWFAVALVVLFCGFYVPILRDASIDQNLDFLYQPPVIEAENAYQAPGACDNYSGILHIREGDPYAATGTLFFVYTINQILYSKLHNLLPWIHFDAKGVCYDRKVHQNNTMKVIRISGMAFAQEIKLQGKRRGCGNPKRPLGYPGDVSEVMKNVSTVSLYGNGIWGSYFDPLVEFDWKDPSCQRLPIVHIPSKLVSPGIHRCAPWAVRPWQMKGMPERQQPSWANQSLHDWFGAMRSTAHAIVKQYYRPRPWLQSEIGRANPYAGRCLAMHIRMTDKGHGRVKIPLNAFLPYAQAYASATRDTKIYVATDDERILAQITSEWPQSIVERIVSRNDTLRSQQNDTPVFDAFANDRHRVNTEALVEIYAMSRCHAIIHGYSALTEASIYINYRQLHNHSVCLDQNERMSVSQFQSLLASKAFS